MRRRRVSVPPIDGVAVKRSGFGKRRRLAAAICGGERGYPWQWERESRAWGIFFFRQFSCVVRDEGPRGLDENRTTYGRLRNECLFLDRRDSGPIRFNNMRL